MNSDTAASFSSTTTTAATAQHPQREPNEKRVDSYPKIMAVERVVRLAEVRCGGEGEVKD